MCYVSLPQARQSPFSLFPSLRKTSRLTIQTPIITSGTPVTSFFTFLATTKLLKSTATVSRCVTHHHLRGWRPCFFTSSAWHSVVIILGFCSVLSPRKASIGFKPLFILILSFLSLCCLRTMPIVMSHSSTHIAHSGQPLILESHPYPFIFHALDVTPPPKWFVDLQLNSDSHKLRLIYLPWPFICFNIATYTIAVVFPGFFRHELKRQPPHLDPKRRVRESNVRRREAFSPSTQKQQVIVKIPWAILLYPLHLVPWSEFKL